MPLWCSAPVGRRIGSGRLADLAALVEAAEAPAKKRGPYKKRIQSRHACSGTGHDPERYRGEAEAPVQGRFQGSHFEATVIVQAVSWYLRYPLSYRDIEEMLLERGLEVDHSTVNRWVLA